MDDHLHFLEPLRLKNIKEHGASVGKLQGKKVAAYKDGDKIKAVSAICTHKF